MRNTGFFLLLFFLLLGGSLAVSAETENVESKKKDVNASALSPAAPRELAQWRKPPQNEASQKESDTKKPSHNGENPNRNGDAKKDSRKNLPNRDWAGKNPGSGTRDFMNGRNLAEMKEKHPKFFELIQRDIDLERKAKQLSRDWKEAAAGEKDGIKEELTKTATEHFQIRQQRRLYELQLLEERISEMRKEIEGREGKMDRIVKKRLHDLLEKEGDLDF